MRNSKKITALFTCVLAMAMSTAAFAAETADTSAYSFNTGKKNYAERHAVWEK